ncbi:MAG: hypothetical protein ACWA6U_09445 [Breznakibacter sp.]
MKEVKLKYIKPEFIVYSLDNEISLQMTSENTTPGGGGLPRSESSSASTATSPNPFDENSFKEE